jgi:hypothetical protein
MIVKCQCVELDLLGDDFLRNRLRKSIHLDDLREYFEVGQSFNVQAIEEIQGGIWVYIHTSLDMTYPNPFPIELFSIEEAKIPEGWCVRFAFDNGGSRIKRISFEEWANNDSFYENLVDGDPDTVCTYKLMRQKVNE